MEDGAIHNLIPTTNASSAITLNIHIFSKAMISPSPTPKLKSDFNTLTNVVHLDLLFI